MKLSLLAIIFFPLIFGDFECQKNNDNTSSEYKEMYTTGDLSLRVSPSTESIRKNLIPPGVKVEVKKTSNKQTIDNREAYWYYSRQLDGYLFGAYLQEALFKLENPFVLNRWEKVWNCENLSSPSTEINLELSFFSENQAIVSSKVKDYRGQSAESNIHNFRITEKGFEVVFNDKKEERVNRFFYDPELSAFTKEIQLKMKYDNDFKAFIQEDCETGSNYILTAPYRLKK